ncbi:MAG: 50S ribosomal protein L25 [Caldilineaceae bacterium]
MDDLKLVADRRELTGRKVGQLRRQGLVPVVVYGNVKQPVNLQVDIKQLERMLHAGGDTRVVEVTVNGGGLHNVLVKNVQREPVGHRLLHADFYAVNMSEKQRVTVPLVTTGKPAGMVTGVMVLKLHEAIHIEALPADIPGEIEVDISPMTMERPITIADLPKVKGVSYVDDPEEVLFNLQLTREEVAEEAAAAEVEPEVVKKGKQTDEDED